MSHCTCRFIDTVLIVFGLTIHALSAEEVLQRGTVFFENAPAGAAVYLDGTWIGAISSDGRFTLEQLPAGPLHLVVATDTSPLFDRKITFTDTVALTFSLGPPPSMDSSPPGNTEPAESGSPPPKSVHEPQTVQPLPVVARTGDETDNTPFAGEGNTRRSKPLEWTRLSPVDSETSADYSFVWPMLLLALLLPAGFIMFYLLWRRRIIQKSISPEAPADAESDTGAAGEADDLRTPAAAPSPSTASEPNFLEDLHHKETLFSKGFRSVKAAEDPEQIVLDLTDYRVGE
ncbi:MAG: hypothetical protein JXQ27_01315 [Acidobacteria bacterium]|nr:hypothetical protein [Acidobacteriota bacterium]